MNVIDKLSYLNTLFYRLSSDPRRRTDRYEFPCGVLEAIELICLFVLTGDLVFRVSCNILKKQLNSNEYVRKIHFQMMTPKEKFFEGIIWLCWRNQYKQNNYCYFSKEWQISIVMFIQSNLLNWPILVKCEIYVKCFIYHNLIKQFWFYKI